MPYVNVNKQQDNKTPTTVDVSPKQQASRPAVKFVDKQAEVGTQPSLHEVANNSTRIKPLKTLQQMANNRPAQLKPAQGISAPVVQREFDEETYHDIRQNQPLLNPGMGLMYGGYKLGEMGVKGLQAGASIAAAPYNWASQKIQATDSTAAKVGYGALGALGSLVSVPAGIIAGGVMGSAGIGTGVAVGGVGAGVTALGGIVHGAKETIGPAVKALSKTSIKIERGYYPPTSTHPVYGDRPPARADEPEPIVGGSRSAAAGMGSPLLPASALSWDDEAAGYGSMAEPEHIQNLRRAMQDEQVSRRPEASPFRMGAPSMDVGEHNAQGARLDYNRIRRPDLVKYGLLGGTVAAGGAAKIADLHSYQPGVAMAGGIGGVVGAVSDLGETYYNTKEAFDPGKSTQSRALSGVSAIGSLSSATQASATSAANFANYFSASEAVSAGAQMAAGGAAIATGGIDMARGIYGAKLAHDRAKALNTLSGQSFDKNVSSAAKAAERSQERERTKGIATALKGGASIAGGVLLVTSMATPIGWALLGGAALIGGIAAIYNWKKKRETKEEIATEVLGIKA